MERQIAVSAREVTTRRGVRSTAYGSLGIASSGPVGTSVVIDVGGEPVLEVGVNNDRTCVRLGNGRIKCWGYNGGVLGIESTSLKLEIARTAPYIAVE